MAQSDNSPTLQHKETDEKMTFAVDDDEEHDGAYHEKDQEEPASRRWFLKAKSILEDESDSDESDSELPERVDPPAIKTGWFHRSPSIDAAKTESATTTAATNNGAKKRWFTTSSNQARGTSTNDENSSSSEYSENNNSKIATTKSTGWFSKRAPSVEETTDDDTVNETTASKAPQKRWFTREQNTVSEEATNFSLDDNGKGASASLRSDSVHTAATEIMADTQSNGEPLSMKDRLRKGAVAVSGTAVTAVGLVMIPLPTPFGCVVATSGLALLGTEFPAAQRTLQSGRDGLIRAIDKASHNHNEDANQIRKSAKKQLQKTIPILKKIGSTSKDGVQKGTAPEEWSVPKTVETVTTKETAAPEPSQDLLGEEEEEEEEIEVASLENALAVNSCNEK